MLEIDWIREITSKEPRPYKFRYLNGWEVTKSYVSKEARDYKLQEHLRQTHPKSTSRVELQDPGKDWEKVR